ncbi:MAG: adenylosuccinate lyase [Chloroflexota bacterium]
MGNYEVYQSPFSWRYGSMEMRRIWGEYNKRHLWRQLWVALAEVQEHFGLVSTEKVADLHAHMDSVNVDRALEIESEIQHDLMAELKTFAEQAKIGGAILHLGATSMDIEDNAEVLRIRQSLNLVLDKLVSLLLIFAEKIETWADLPLMAFTHLQPAEPSTLGYRLAQYAQDLLMDWQDLLQVKRNLCGKGFKGAVGTSASYAELIGVENLILFEHMLSERLGLSFFSIATQVYTRKQDYSVISGLAGLGGSLYKFAFDVRILQSPSFGEWNEPFGKKQVGSSAMPFKRNPINAEKINSLGRALAQMPRLAWDNAAHSLLERTLDDSANRRTLLPESFLICDEILSVATKLVKGLQISESAIRRNLAMYAPFAATERVLMALCKQGADRQEIHERLRIHALKAWDGVQRGKTNPLDKSISKDLEFQRYLSETALQNLMDVNNHLGDAPQRAREFAAALRREIEIRPEI